MSNLSSNLEVERELLLDQLIYGTSFHKVVDGQKVRIDPTEVYIRLPNPPWYRRLWGRLRRFLHV